MRISDWSSDVCSSDLREGDHRIIGLGVQRLADDGADLDAAEPHVTAIHQTIRTAEMRLQFIALDPAAADARRGIGKRQQDAGRSEEHTSELQSLMRISYAVFCLQKQRSPLTRANRADLHRRSNMTS